MSRTGPRPFWTAARLAQLRALWEQGLDNGELATQLGDGVTRGAVATALRRHGMRSHLPKRTPHFLDSTTPGTVAIVVAARLQQR